MVLLLSVAMTFTVLTKALAQQEDHWAVLVAGSNTYSAARST